MAEGGNYEDSSSNSDPWSGVEYPEEGHGGEERTDEREKAEVHFPETRKLSPLLRNEAESKDWRIVEYFGWEQPEVERRRIIVIGMDTSTESEFAFQHYLNYYHCRKWIVIVVYGLPKRSASKMEKKRKDLFKCEELRTKYRNRFENCKLSGAFIAAECDRPGKLIVAEAEHFNATYVVTGKRRIHPMKRLYVHSVSKYVVEHAPCSVLVFKILRGWKAGESTRQPSSQSDSPEPRPKAVSPKQQVLQTTSQSKNRHLPRTSAEAVSSTKLVPSQETLCPKRLSHQSAPGASSKKWQLPPPAQESFPPKRDLSQSAPDAISITTRLYSSETEQTPVKRFLDRPKVQLVSPKNQLYPIEVEFVLTDSHLEPSEVQKSPSESSKVESAIRKSQLDLAEMEVVPEKGHSESSCVQSTESVSPKSRLEPSEVESSIPKSLLDLAYREIVPERGHVER